MPGFQNAVNVRQAPGVPGQFAGGNPRAAYIAGPEGLVAGPNGVTIGCFAWVSAALVDLDDAPAQANSTGAGPVAGFVHNEQQGLNTTFLSSFSMKIPQGFPVTLMTEGDFWVANAGATEVQVGQKAYANFANGTVSFAATGSPLSGAVGTGAVAASTFSVTGSITDNILTVTATSSGTVVPGATISGTNIASGTKIVAQLTGTPGGVGTYRVSIAGQSAASTTVSGTYGTLTISAMTSGAFGVGGTITGTGISVPTTITALGTGVGQTGTYIVDVNTVVASTTITQAGNVETKFFAMTPAAPGEYVKITSHSLG